MSRDPGGGAAQWRSLDARRSGRDPVATASSLVEELREGSREAMSTVFAEHLDVVYNYCYRRTASWAVAEDLSATVFLEVWRHRRRAVELDGSVLPWLYGIATNVCRNHLRSRRRGAQAMTRLELVESTDPGSPLLDDRIADRIDADRRLQRALTALAELPPDDQNVFVLVCWEHLSYAQAAQALGIPIGTVRSRVARVRRRLRLVDVAEPADPEPEPASRRPTQEDDHV